MFMTTLSDNMCMLDMIDDSLREFKRTYHQLKKGPVKVKAKPEEVKAEEP